MRKNLKLKRRAAELRRTKKTKVVISLDLVTGGVNGSDPRVGGRPVVILRGAGPCGSQEAARYSQKT